MIEIIYGTLGGSKTCTAVTRMTQYLERGCHVATNVELCREGIEKVCGEEAWERVKILTELDEITQFYKHCVTGADEHNLVVIDEAHMYFNSRDHSRNHAIHRGLYDWLTLSRRYRTDVIFISQTVTRIDSQIVALAETFTKCRDWSRLPVIGIFWPGFYEVNYDSDRKTKLRGTFHRRNADIFSCYNTNQVVKKVEGAGEIAKVSGNHGTTTGRKIPWPLILVVLLAGFAVWKGLDFWRHLKGGAGLVDPSAAPAAGETKYVRTVETPALPSAAPPPPEDTRSELEKFIDKAPYLLLSGRLPNRHVYSGSIQFGAGSRLGRWRVLQIDREDQVWLVWHPTGETKILQLVRPEVDPGAPAYRYDRPLLQSNEHIQRSGTVGPDANSGAMPNGLRHAGAGDYSQGGTVGGRLIGEIPALPGRR